MGAWLAFAGVVVTLIGGIAVAPVSKGRGPRETNATIQAHGDTKQKFQSEWMQVCTVWNGKITRWRMFSDTAARYGH